MGNVHVGIAHCSGDTVYALHLAWDCDLRNEPIEKSRQAFPTPTFVLLEIDPIEGKYFAGRFRRIAEIESNSRISYCLGHFPYPETYFDENMIFKSSDPSRIGLNCSAFVIQAFSAALYPIVDITGWPSRGSDEPIQRWLLCMMERERDRGVNSTITGEKVQFARSQIGSPRVAPEEVAGACMETRASLPAGFA